MIGYHFTAETLCDGRPIPKINRWLVHKGPVISCESGLHASKHPFDALMYATGARLHRVELVGELVPYSRLVDKYAGRSRKILASIDATQLLWDFARWCALQVIDQWNAPDIVCRYLETGDESLRAASWAAAVDAAWSSRAASGAAVAAAFAAAFAAWAASVDAAVDARNDAVAAQKIQFAKMVRKAFRAAEAAKGETP